MEQYLRMKIQSARGGHAVAAGGAEEVSYASPSAKGRVISFGAHGPAASSAYNTV